MLRIYIVMYDIRDDRRLRLVFKKMSGFGQHIQYSVFRCALSPANKMRMKSALSEIIDHRQDQVLIMDWGPADAYRADSVETLGQAYVVESPDAVVI